MARLRIIRRAFLVVVAVAVVVGLGVGVYAYRLVGAPLPQTSGEVVVPGLQGRVDVVRDERGVPTIYADTASDLFRAEGFVHAQDRFFEMDLRRHITAGRLAELIGADGVASDRVIRTMGWRRVAEREIATLAPTTRQYLQAYADGVNAYLEDRALGDVAIEYVVLGRRLPDYRIEEWTPADSLAWLKAMAWDLRGDYADELTRARLAGRVPAGQLADLYPPYPVDQHPPILSGDDWKPSATGGSAAPARTPASKPAGPATPRSGRLLDRAYAATRGALAAVPELVGTGEGIGSNSWVVAGSKTTTGKPLLANDPHLATSMPGVFYQASLRCRALTEACPFDVSGFTFAGAPGVVIGHNARIAWGFANLAPDVTDFYLERITDVTYLRDGEQVPLNIRTETIEVADGEPQAITIRETVHGPVLSDVVSAVADAGDAPLIDGDVQSGRYAVSLAWTALAPAKTADAVFRLNRAADFTDFRRAAKDFEVPAQTMIYADIDGHIGYQTPGRIPVRQSAVAEAPPGYWPAPGWESDYDWTGYVPFEDLPWALDPAEGFIVAANQAVTAESAAPYLTSGWDPGWRSTRIRDLIRHHEAVSPEEMASIQADTYSGFARRLVGSLLAVRLDDPFVAEAQNLLREWDFTAPVGDSPHSAAAAYYNAVWANVVEMTFNDELPSDLLSSGGGSAMRAVDLLLARPDDQWWDNRQTPGVVESRDVVLRQALVDARLDLTRELGRQPEKWDWGRLHTVTFEHRVLGGDSAPGLIRRLVDSKVYGAPGGSALVDANNWNVSAGYAVTSAPAARMIVDLADFDASRWANQTGQSGHPRSDHYDDQIDAWLKVETAPWPWSRAAVEESADETLTLLPGPTS